MHDTAIRCRKYAAIQVWDNKKLQKLGYRAYKDLDSEAFLPVSDKKGIISWVSNV